MPPSLRSSTRTLRTTAPEPQDGSSEPGPSSARATVTGAASSGDGAPGSTSASPPPELRARAALSRVASISTEQQSSQGSSSSTGTRGSRRSTRASLATESQSTESRPDLDGMGVDSTSGGSTTNTAQHNGRSRRSQRSTLSEVAGGSGSSGADRSNLADLAGGDAEGNSNNAIDGEARARRSGSRISGGDAPSRAIDLEELLLSSDDEDDDGFTLVSSHTNPAPSRHHLLLEELLSAGRNNNATGSNQAESSLSVDVPPVRNRSTYHITDGLPAGPHRYRHRERAVHFAPGTALGSTAAGADESAPPEVSVLRRLNFYPSPYASGGRFGSTEHRRMPEKYEEKWTHPHPETAGFSNSIVEPPIELDADPVAVPTAPLPDTTPICARCRYALQIGGSGDKKVWVLPCGHVIDGKCVRELSDPDRKIRVGSSGKAPVDIQSQVNGKAKAATLTEPTNTLKRSASQRDEEEPLPSADTDEEPSAVEPLSKKPHIDDQSTTAPSYCMLQEPTDPDVSSQSFEVVWSHKVTNKNATVSAEDDDDEPVVSAVNLQPTHFECPVADCKQPCYPKGDHDLSIIELFL